MYYHTGSWDRCFYFKNMLPKNVAKILEFFYRKLAKIAENCDHNIDRWTHFPDLKRAKTETIDCHLRKNLQTSKNRICIFWPEHLDILKR
jgi:hypothetical protein